VRVLVAAVCLFSAAASAQTPPDLPPDLAPLPPAWVERGTALLVGLDKVSAQTTKLTVPVGGTAQFAGLSIAVKSCLVRPPDQAPDSTAFLDIATPGNPGAPGFHGWMIASAPAVSEFEHPTLDVRLIGCQ